MAVFPHDNQFPYENRWPICPLGCSLTHDILFADSNALMPFAYLSFPATVTWVLEERDLSALPRGYLRGWTALQCRGHFASRTVMPHSPSLSGFLKVNALSFIFAWPSAWTGCVWNEWLSRQVAESMPRLEPTKCCFWTCFLVKFIQAHRWHFVWIYGTCNGAPSCKPWSVPSRRSQGDDRLCSREMDETEWESKTFAVDLLLSWPFRFPLPRNYLYVMVEGFGFQKLRFLPKVTYLVNSLSTGWASWGWNR